MEEKGISALCRICLNNSFMYSNIYVGHSSECNPIFESINYVYDLQICVEDGLPEYVCHECLTVVKKFELYKTNAHKAKSQLMYLKQKIDEGGNCVYGKSDDETNENQNWQATPVTKVESCSFEAANEEYNEHEEMNYESGNEISIKEEKVECYENEPEDAAVNSYEENAFADNQPEETRLQFVTTEKRKRKLYLEGHLYFKDKEKDEKIYWKCEKFHKFKCKARVLTVGQRILKQSGEHNHTTDDSRVEASKILSIIHANALDMNDTPQDIISKACLGFSQEAIASLPKMETIRRTIRNIRIRYGAGLEDQNAQNMFSQVYESEKGCRRQEC